MLYAAVGLHVSNSQERNGNHVVLAVWHYGLPIMLLFEKLVCLTVDLSLCTMLQES